MKPAPFEYLRPSSIAEALALLGEHCDAAILAGSEARAVLISVGVDADVLVGGHPDL